MSVNKLKTKRSRKQQQTDTYHIKTLYLNVTKHITTIINILLNYTKIYNIYIYTYYI